MPNASTCFDTAVGVLGSGSIGSNTTITSAAVPTSCSVTQLPNSSQYTVVFNDNPSSTVPCGVGGSDALRVSGVKTSLVELSLDINGHTGLVTIALTGPADAWFGVGFNADAMADNPYAIIVDGNGVVTERQLADENPGTLLSGMVHLVSMQVQDGIRSVVVQRPLAGVSPAYYTFSPDITNLAFINAIGSTVEISYHKARTAATIALFQPGATTCLCEDKVGTINGIPYEGDCKPEPLVNSSSLLISLILRNHYPSCLSPT